MLSLNLLPSTFQLISVALYAATLLAATILWVFFVAPRRLAVWNLPGPPREHLLAGNLARFAKEEKGSEIDRLSTVYGHTFKIHELFGDSRVVSLDPLFINHILRNSNIYPKDLRTRNLLTMLMPGTGVLTAEGDVHKRQRRGLAPAFSSQNVKALSPIFLEHAHILKNRLTEEITRARLAKQGGIIQEGGIGGGFLQSLPTVRERGKAEGAVLDVSKWLGRATLDIIGSAGFDYDFAGLRDDNSEFSQALDISFSVFEEMCAFLVLQIIFPVLQRLPSSSSRALHLSKDKIRRMGDEMVRRKKKAAFEAAKDEGEERVGRENVSGHNLLAQMVRANMASDVPESARMSDGEVAAQIGTFVLAGFETSSSALTWMIYALSEDLEVQSKLREELFQVRDVMPSSDTLAALSYLEAVIRETLRLYAPVPSTVRTTAKTDVVPFSVPVVGKDGKVMNEIVLEPGVSIVIPILNVNRSTVNWGEDAGVFRPERWFDGSIPAANKAFDSPFANTLTFLSGPRACIGQRFALAEIQALAFVLVRSFVFKPVNIHPKLEYAAYGQIVQTPKIRGRENEGAQMLLEVLPVGDDFEC